VISSPKLADEKGIEDNSGGVVCVCVRAPRIKRSRKSRRSRKRRRRRRRRRRKVYSRLTQ